MCIHKYWNDIKIENINKKRNRKELKIVNYNKL